MICGSFFSGIGLLDYGLHLAGFEHAWGCEADEWRRQLWEQRFRAPCHPDIRAFDIGWGRVDLVAGGFPCKGASSAGKREGFGHPETVLWREMARAVGELRPRYVLVENVANILGLHDGAVWGEVLGDLAALGYDTGWDCLPAAAVGAPHRRDRVFAIATHAEGEPERTSDDEAHAESRGRDSREVSRLRGVEPVADADFARADAHAAAGGPRPAASERDSTPSDASRDAEGRPAPKAGSDGERTGTGNHVAADAERGVHGRAGPRDVLGSQGAREGEAPERQRVRPHVADGDVSRRVGVEWGGYEPAIRRWEAVHGPAPEPLIAGVDARSAAKVVRSRLSALGDGVQVQVGYLAGAHIFELERQRLLNASTESAA